MYSNIFCFSNHWSDYFTLLALFFLCFIVSYLLIKVSSSTSSFVTRSSASSRMNSPYECGFLPSGDSHGSTKTLFYIICELLLVLLFLLYLVTVLILETLFYFILYVTLVPCTTLVGGFIRFFFKLLVLLFTQIKQVPLLLVRFSKDISVYSSCIYVVFALISAFVILSVSNILTLIHILYPNFGNRTKYEDPFDLNSNIGSGLTKKQVLLRNKTVVAPSEISNYLVDLKRINTVSSIFLSTSFFGPKSKQNSSFYSKTLILNNLLPLVGNSTHVDSSIILENAGFVFRRFSNTTFLHVDTFAIPNLLFFGSAEFLKSLPTVHRLNARYLLSEHEQLRWRLSSVAVKQHMRRYTVIRQFTDSWKTYCFFNNDRNLPPVPEYVVNLKEYTNLVISLTKDLLYGNFLGSRRRSSFKYLRYREHILSNVPAIFKLPHYKYNEAESRISSVSHLSLLKIFLNPEDDLANYFDASGSVNFQVLQTYFVKQYEAEQLKKFSKLSHVREDHILDFKTSLSEDALLRSFSDYALNFCVPESQESSYSDDYGYGMYIGLWVYLRIWDICVFFKLASPETEEQRAHREFMWRFVKNRNIYDYSDLTMPILNYCFAFRYGLGERLMASSLVIRDIFRCTTARYNKAVDFRIADDAEFAADKELQQFYEDIESDGRVQDPLPMSPEYILFNIDYWVEVLQYHYEVEVFSFNYLDFISVDDPSTWTDFYILISYANFTVAEEYPVCDPGVMAEHAYKHAIDTDPIRYAAFISQIYDPKHKLPCFLDIEVIANVMYTERISARAAEHFYTLATRRWAVRRFRNLSSFTRPMLRTQTDPWNWRTWFADPADEDFYW